MKIYRYKPDRRTRFWAAVHIVVIALGALGLAYLYEGGYLSAWFVSLAAALVALTTLSIPRRLVVGEHSVLIRCVLDITEIPLGEIASVRAVDNREMRWTIPVFGTAGFFGYYGHYFDLKNMRHVEIYASTWRNFVEITTIYEDVYYVSCDARDEFIADLTAGRQEE